jgi:VanZ family protein
MAKIGGLAVLVLLLLFCALGPAKLQFRTGLGWRMDHVIGYFGFTLMFWLAWQRRPFVLGGAFTVTAMLLEALQALTPDRHCDFQGALYGVAGALAAAVCADLFTRIHRLLSGGRFFHPSAVHPAAIAARPRAFSSRRWFNLGWIAG